jgi:hypothetical protein
MPFEVFDKRAATATKSPMATIQKRGLFSINKAAYDLLGAPEAVELLYDPEEKLIGFRPVAPTSPRAFPVRSQGANASTFMIAGRAFAQHYGLNTETARRYAVEMRDDILVIDLKSDSVDVTGPRAAMKSRLGRE